MDDWVKGAIFIFIFTSASITAACFEVAYIHRQLKRIADSLERYMRTNYD